MHDALAHIQPQILDWLGLALGLVVRKPVVVEDEPSSSLELLTEEALVASELQEPAFVNQVHLTTWGRVSEIVLTAVGTPTEGGGLG